MPKHVKEEIRSELVTTYNGWSNYETWVVGLWLGNDEVLHKTITEKAVEVLRAEKDNSLAEIALVNYLKDFVEEYNPLEDEDRPASMYSDLLGHAINRVDWFELASHYIEDAGENVE